MLTFLSKFITAEIMVVVYTKGEWNTQTQLSVFIFHTLPPLSTLRSTLHTPNIASIVHIPTSHSDPLPLYSAFKLKDQWQINLCRPFFHYSMIEVIFTISRILFLQTVQGGVKCTVHYGRIWWLKQLFKIVNKN